MAKELTIVVGTYTFAGSKGIYSYRLNLETGEATLLDTELVTNPSFLTLSNDNRHIYAITEDGQNSFVHAFSFDKETGKIALLNTVESPADPCHITLLSGHTLSVASYTDGCVALFDISEDEQVTENGNSYDLPDSSTHQRQQSSHIHFTAVTPNGKYLVADNLGGDCIHILKVLPQDDGTARLEVADKVKVHAEAGPRHIAFSPDGRYAYLITELSEEVMAFRYDDGHLTPVQTLLAAEERAHAAGHIMVHPNGKWLYVSLRRAKDGIAIYQIDENGLLTKVGYQLVGLHPRHFNITPDGTMLLCACRDSDVIQIYDINPSTGLLTLKSEIEVNHPVCIQFVD